MRKQDRNVTITLDKSIRRDLELMKIQLIKREERNITYKDVFAELLSRFNVDERYREEVKQCLKQDAPRNYEAHSIAISVNEKAQLLLLAKSNDTSVMKLARCLIKVYQEKNLVFH